MNSKWKSIWEKKNLENIDLKKDQFSVFCDLKRTDGFDVCVHDEQAYFMAFYNEWVKMYKELKNILGGQTVQSIYEVGCGCGVNLYLFQNRMKDAVLGGIDYSQNLIDIAKRVVPSGKLVWGNAEDMDIVEKYDFVMADSVFQYFGDREYAEDILNKMILKSQKAVYVSEVHDMDLREEWLAYRRSSMENYDRIYENLDKLFFSRKWFVEIAEKHNKQILFTKNENSEYWNSRYVFNCFIF